MFDWLFEGQPAVYALLATFGVLFAGLWWRDRKRHWLIGVGIVLVLIGAYFLLDRLVETGREQIERKLPAIARAVTERKPEGVLAHVSDQFSWEGLDKKAFGERLPGWLNQINGLKVWDVGLPDGRPQKGKVARVIFYAKPEEGRMSNEAFVRCEAELVCDPDGQWRLKGFKVFFPPTGDTATPVLPYLGQ